MTVVGGARGINVEGEAGGRRQTEETQALSLHACILGALSVGYTRLWRLWFVTVMNRFSVWGAFAFFAAMPLNSD